MRILADGSIRPIGTGTQCSCGGESFAVVGDRKRPPEDGETVTDEGDEREYPTP